MTLKLLVNIIGVVSSMSQLPNTQILCPWLPWSDPPWKKNIGQYDCKFIFFNNYCSNPIELLVTILYAEIV